MIDVTDKIVDKGRNLFNLVSALPASKLDAECTRRLNKWIEDGKAGFLDYMKRPLDRTDLRVIMPDVMSVVVVARFYDREQKMPGVARFAQNEDYHVTIKNDLYRLLQQLKESDPTLKGRAVVDSAPVFEKAWAVRAGFGWVGRNTLIINPDYGSFFNIGLLLLNKELPVYPPVKILENGCKDCRLCIDSCPMHAIGEDRTIDARKCISCLTVEKSRKKLPVIPIHGWVYGCDECQICCPFNR